MAAGTPACSCGRAGCHCCRLCRPGYLPQQCSAGEVPYPLHGQVPSPSRTKTPTACRPCAPHTPIICQQPPPSAPPLRRYDAGFFPLDLQVRASNEPADAPFKPLAALLLQWNKPVGPPGFAAAGAASAPAAPALQPEPALPVVSAFEAAAAIAPAPSMLSEAPLPVELPEADDLLAASLGHLELAPSAGAAPAAAPAAPAPAPPEPAASEAPTPEDPVVDPSLLRRAAPGAHLIPQPAPGPAPVLGGPLAQLPLGGPLAQLQALGSSHLQGHPDLLAAAAGHFQQQQAAQAAGLLPQQDLFAPPQHLLAAQHGVHLPPAPLPPQQQFAPVAPAQQQAQQQPAELPSWLTESVPGPAAPAALEPAVPAQPAPAPAPAPPAVPAQPAAAPAAPAPARRSLLDIQREQEMQEAEARRRAQAEAQRRAAAAAEEHARRQREAELLPSQASAALAEDDHVAAETAKAAGPRPETKVAPWAAAAVPKKKKTGAGGPVAGLAAEPCAAMPPRCPAFCAVYHRAWLLAAHCSCLLLPATVAGKTLLEIQQEEAERARRLAEQEAAAAAAAPAGAIGPAGGWAKAARGNTSGGRCAFSARRGRRGSCMGCGVAPALLAPG